MMMMMMIINVEIGPTNSRIAVSQWDPRKILRGREHVVTKHVQAFIQTPLRGVNPLT